MSKGIMRKGIHTSFHFKEDVHGKLRKISTWARRSMAGELEYLINKEYEIRKESHEQGEG